MDQCHPAPIEAETEAERRDRLAAEAEMIATARRSVAAGRTVSFEEVEAWLASLGTDQALPRPRPRA